jgi:hypothetical protein
LPRYLGDYVRRRLPRAPKIELGPLIRMAGMIIAMELIECISLIEVEQTRARNVKAVLLS